MSRLIRDKYIQYQQTCLERFNQLKANEEELNRIFIDIYGLQGELTPEVADKDVTVYRIIDSPNDEERKMAYVLSMRDEIVSLVSYIVGCMLGRYSPYVDGLLFAGGRFSDQCVVVSGQVHAAGEVADCVREELYRIAGLAAGDGAGGDDLSADSEIAKRRDLCAGRPDAQSFRFDSVEYRRGTSQKFYEGIHTISSHRTGIERGTGDAVYDLCSPEILDAITGGNGAELVRRGWKDAERIDWQSIHSTLTTDHFTIDKDAIIPVTDDEYFTDDIVARTAEFVKKVYGAETLEENLKFIADALGNKGDSPREVIRNYYLDDFYKDHLKTYQKRPIYWQFDSGKQNGFKCLTYLHRYDRDTVARVRTDYVHEQQERLRTQLDDAQKTAQTAEGRQRTNAAKRAQKLEKQLNEVNQYEEIVHHYADMRMEIDLDDGVKVNYAKFGELLTKIK